MIPQSLADPIGESNFCDGQHIALDHTDYILRVRREILLQVRGAGLGSAFGGNSSGSVFKTRRGVERLVFNMTILFVILFAAVSVLGALLR